MSIATAWNRFSGDRQLVSYYTLDRHIILRSNKAPYWRYITGAWIVATREIFAATHRRKRKPIQPEHWDVESGQTLLANPELCNVQMAWQVEVDG